MASQFLKDIAAGQLAQRAAGVRPSVDRPRVGVPSPFDDDSRMDISDRFRPYETYSGDAATTTTYDSDSPFRSYRGPITPTAMTQSVADQFVGLPKGVGIGISGTGLGTFAGIGAAISLKNLQRIEEKVAAAHGAQARRRALRKVGVA